MGNHRYKLYELQFQSNLGVFKNALLSLLNGKMQFPSSSLKRQIVQPETQEFWEIITLPNISRNPYCGSKKLSNDTLGNTYQY